MIALLGGAWACVEGADVCPRHQTRAERIDLARQIVSAIEREITRTQDLDPSPVEPGLAVYAMQLREALAAAEKSQPETRNRIHLDIAITGAFLTGCPLRIGIKEYGRVQSELATRLSERADHGWKTSAEQLRDGTYESGGGFSDVLPLVLVCREGEDVLAHAAAILCGRPKYEHDWLDSRTGGWTVEPSSMRIEVYDLGVAVINGTFAVDVPADVSLGEAARKVKEIVWLRPDPNNRSNSPITEMFRELSRETTLQFREGVKTSVSQWKQRPWLSTGENRQSSGDWGRLLWLHPVHMLVNEDPATHRAGAKALAPAFSKSVKVQDGRFVPGIGWSVIITDQHKSARAVPMKLLQLHWAYIALYMEIDRGLLTILDQHAPDRKRPALTELEDAAQSVFNDYIRVMEARARVDSALASLGGDEQAIWDAMACVTKFDALVGGVDRKVEVLQRIADRRVQEATAAYARRSAIILGFLTTLALVTLGVTVLSYFLGGLADQTQEQHWSLRWQILGLGAVLALLLWGFTFELRPWRWGRRERRPPP